MRFPVLHQSLSLFKELAPQACLTVLDIGVQRKTTFLMDVFPESFHHLFEPVSLYFESIHSNYSQQDIDYRLHKLALSDQAGILYLHKSSRDGSGNVTHSQIYPDKRPNTEMLVEIEDVKTSTLDQAMADISLIEQSYIVKLDVDGEEEKIITGGSKVLSGASLVVIECSLGRKDLVKRTQLLESLGFRLWDICDNAYYFDQLAIVDLVFINEEIRKNDIHFRPWELTNGMVDWKKWQVSEKWQIGETSQSALPDSVLGVVSQECPFCLTDTCSGPRATCSTCKRTDRHRTVLSVYEALMDHFKSGVCLNLTDETWVSDKWFKRIESSIYNGKNHIDIQKIDRADSTYDWVVCNHILEHVKEHLVALSELFRVISDSGIIQITVPIPSKLPETVDWGYPDKDKSFHFRHYGCDFGSLLRNQLPSAYIIVVISQDELTDFRDLIYLIIKDVKKSKSIKQELLLSGFLVLEY